MEDEQPKTAKNKPRPKKRTKPTLHRPEQSASQNVSEGPVVLVDGYNPNMIKIPKTSFTEQFLVGIGEIFSPTQEGPIYPKTDESLVLYEADESVAYHPINKPGGLVPVVVNPYFSSILKPEQVEGLKFMWAWYNKHTGCILAHEMGLGKTLTSIALLWTLLEQKEESRGKSVPSLNKVVIVTPKGLGEIWKNEFSKWAPDGKNLEVEILESRARDGNTKIEEFETNEKQVLVLSYDSWKKYKLELSYYKNPLKLVLCDEAHILKNVNTQKSSALKCKLRDRENGFISDTNLVKVFIGLTGTPFQNNEEQLCNLVDFFQPGILGPNFKEEFIKPILLDENSKNTKKSEEEKEILKQIAKRKRALLHRIIKPAMQITRKFEKVDRHELIVVVDLPETDDELIAVQRKLYSSLVQSIGRVSSFYSQLDLLRKVCIHPIHAFDSIKEKPELVELYNEYLPLIERMGNEKFPIIYSAKLHLLFRMLASIKSRHPSDKVVVVSSSVDMLEFIKEACHSEALKKFKLKCRMYYGPLNEPKRKSTLDHFNSNWEGVFVLLLSEKSGGVGLDLTAANHLFLLDPDWNPANDKQVQSRIYRPGQTKDCFIYRFLTKNTIDEVILLNQLSKVEMEKFYGGSDPNAVRLNGYNAADLTKLLTSVESYIKDKLEELREQSQWNRETDDDNPDDSVELRQFAQELLLARHYSTMEDVPGEYLPVLKENMHHGVSYAFHVFRGDDGSTEPLLLDDIWETITESEEGEG